MAVQTGMRGTRMTDWPEDGPISTRGCWPALLSALPDPVFIVYRSGLCHAVNAAARRFFPSDGPRTLLTLTRSAELQALFDEVRDAPVSNLPIVGEITLAHPQERIMHVALRPIATADEPDAAPETFVLLLRDLTEL